MNKLNVTDLNLLALDRAIAQELDVPVGEPIPRYTTDLNVAIEFLPEGWEIAYHHYNNSFIIIAPDRDDPSHRGTIHYGTVVQLATAICKARFPHLWEDES